MSACLSKAARDSAVRALNDLATAAKTGRARAEEAYRRDYAGPASADFVSSYLESVLLELASKAAAISSTLLLPGGGR
ncbi:MAG: hypothetical protein ACTHU0_18380 [Kofleriaceae bacterium]